MKGIFTEYVRALEAGKPPSVEDFEGLWARLRVALRQELRRRHLWHGPPNYLGIYGWQSWIEGPETNAGPSADALDELAAECYTAVFLDRLRSLKAHVVQKPDIEGLVVLYVRQFLHATQKHCDPLGFKVFDVLRAALRRLLDEGRLHILRGNERIRNDTVFGYSPREAGADTGDPFSGSSAAAWSDEIVPALLGIRGDLPSAAVDRLAARILELSSQGVRAFLFRDLVDPLKADVRSRWAMILEDLRGETAPEFEEDDHGRKIVRFIALTRPNAGFEAHEAWSTLVECVDRGLRRLDVRAKTMKYLEKLWGFLHGYALDVEAESVPSHRKLSDLLDIPRERFPELYKTLRGLLEQCGIEGSDKLLATTGGSSAPVGARNMDRRARHESLRLQTGEAAARLDVPKARPQGPPRPGDLYVLDGAGDVEWAVLVRAAGGCLLVPADPLPMTGSHDVAVPRDAAAGPLHLRCAFAVWVDEKRLAGAVRGSSVDARVLARAQARLAEPEEDAECALPAQREVDRDPEYEDWTRDVLAPACDALAERRAPARAQPVSRPASRVSLALAAALLVAVVGLGNLRWRLDVLSRPTVDVARPLQEIVFQERPRGDVLELDPDATHILLPLLLKEQEYGSYVLEVVDAGGEAVWRSRVLEPRRQYRLLVPRARLPAGDYVFRLFGMSDGNEVFVDEQKRRIEYREP